MYRTCERQLACERRSAGTQRCFRQGAFAALETRSARRWARTQTATQGFRPIAYGPRTSGWRRLASEPNDRLRWEKQGHLWESARPALASDLLKESSAGPSPTQPIATPHYASAAILRSRARTRLDRSTEK